MARQAWSRKLAAGLFGAAALFLVVALAQRVKEPATSSVARKETSQLRQLRTMLEALRACVAPTQRKAVAESQRARVDSVRDALATVLMQPAHALFEDAALFCAELALDEFAETLAGSADLARGRARTTAWMALERLQPITDVELTALLQDPSPELVEAGLRIAKSRASAESAVVEDLLRCVRSQDRKLRALALACIPESIADAHTGLVLDLVDENPDDASVAALLARIPPTDRGLQAVTERLRASDAEAMQRITPALVRYAESPKVRAALWLAAGDVDDVERACRALQCLEGAKARDAAPTGSTEWPARMRYGLARLQITTGQIVGVDAMLRLTSPEEDTTAEDATVAADARVALARIARLAPHATADELRAWRSGIVAVPAEPLPPPSR